MQLGDSVHFIGKKKIIPNYWQAKLCIINMFLLGGEVLSCRSLKQLYKIKSHIL